MSDRREMTRARKSQHHPTQTSNNEYYHFPGELPKWFKRDFQNDSDSIQTDSKRYPINQFEPFSENRSCNLQIGSEQMRYSCESARSWFRYEFSNNFSNKQTHMLHRNGLFLQKTSVLLKRSHTDIE